MSDRYECAGLPGIFGELSRRRPHTTALRLPDGNGISFDPLMRAVESFAAQLAAAGIAPADVVALALPNSVEFIVAFLAITSLRATAAPLNAAYTEKEFAFFLADQRAVALLDLPGTAGCPAARSAASELTIPIWEISANDDDPFNATLGGCAPLREPVQPSPVTPATDVALLVHTSGSTSRPKAVPLTHANLLASMRNIAGTYELAEHDCAVLVMPLFHVHGLMAGLLAPLAAGSAVFLPASGKFSAATFWRDMVACGATWYTAVPTIHQILLARYDTDYPKTNPPGLRFIRSCSAPLALAVLRDMEERFGAPVLEAYAMTEAAHQMASNPLPKHGPHKPGSVGKGQSVDLSLRDEAGNAVDTRQVGEIWVRGKNVTAGYLNNPQANRASFRDGWFNTGDLGYLDEDGYLFITGRTKEMINRGGEKIAPGRIDEVLLEHPGVSEAVAFGAPDPKYGEEVLAAVVPKPGVQFTAEELTAFCLQHLSPFEVPKHFFFADALPTTGTGKIQRKNVADHFLGRS